LLSSGVSDNISHALPTSGRTSARGLSGHPEAERCREAVCAHWGAHTLAGMDGSLLREKERQ